MLSKAAFLPVAVAVLALAAAPARAQNVSSPAIRTARAWTSCARSAGCVTCRIA